MGFAFIIAHDRKARLEVSEIKLIITENNWVYFNIKNNNNNINTAKNCTNLKLIIYMQIATSNGCFQIREHSQVREY